MLELRSGQAGDGSEAGGCVCGMASVHLYTWLEECKPP